MRSSRSRRAVTLLELLAVIAVIGVLTSLVLPAVVNARGAARRIQCQSNLKNIGLALNLQSQNKSRLPPGGTFSLLTPDGYTNWVQEILPFLERRDIAEVWHRDLPFNDPQNIALNNVNVAVVTCPDDQTVVSSAGNLSYGANGGFGWSTAGDCPSTMHAMEVPIQFAVPIDLNGDGKTCGSDTNVASVGTDRQIMFRSGVFFMESHPPGSGTVRFHSLDSVLDGLTNTLFVIENFRAGYDPFFPDFGGWASPEAWRACVFISGYTCHQLHCAPGEVDFSLANSKTLPFHWESFNAGHTQPEGRAPWPNSYHTGGVNAVFGDGHVQFISDSLNGRVYVALMSPQGGLIAGPLSQQLITNSDY
jgi:prepilin-type N-terminal cleavage/methylation domain-containing protein/prepilin-type processing-associated H-X9-DG protein